MSTINQINNAPYLERTQQATVFAGSDVSVFAVTVLATGLQMYARHGMQPNRAYTPGNMLRAASSYTGKKYKRGQYEEAATDLLALANELKQLPRIS